MNPTAKPRPYVVVATAGHIDHGKSALVRALTGIDPDRLKEEKERGITIELGFAHATIGGATIAFVDVPGHERFVRTMVSGVGGVDAVMLVVAADESVMPQTREHFDICRLLQVQRGLVVLTKADLADASMREVAALEVRELVRGSFLERAPVLPVSASTGEGLDALRAALVALSEASSAAPSGPTAGALEARLPIDRVFSMTGFGTVVTGTLHSGSLRVDDELVVLPGGRPVRIRGLQMHGKAQAEVGARHRVAVNLAGVDVADLARGQTLAAPGLLTVTRRLDAEIDVLASARRLRHGARVRFHTGTADAFGRLVLAGGDRDVAPGARALLRVRLESPVVLTRGDRFILRSASQATTIAGGRVLDPDPAVVPRRGAERRGPRAPGDANKVAKGVDAQQRLRTLAASSEDDLEALAAMVAERRSKGLALGELASRGGVPRRRVDAVAARLEHGTAGVPGIVRVDDRLVARGVIDDLSAGLVALVTSFHERDPLAEGLPREEARERLFARADPALFDWVLAGLRGSGTLIARDRLALARHTAGLSSDERRAQTMLDRAYREAGLMPPDPMAAAGGVDAAVVRRILELMLRQRALVRVGGLVFHPEALAALKAEVQGLKPSPDARVTVDVATFKQRYGVSRKFAIPLLEWLDRERVTRRVGDVRVVL